MFTCCSRSLLMVNDETPMLYLAEPTPGMMSSNFADCHSVLSPNLPATALNRSTSNPMIVLPSVSRNSLGAYVESVPIMIFPADLTAAGTFAASALSTHDFGWAVLPPLLPLFSPPHAAMVMASAAAAARPKAARLPRGMSNITVSTPLVPLLVAQVTLASTPPRDTPL